MSDVIQKHIDSVVRPSSGDAYAAQIQEAYDALRARVADATSDAESVRIANRALQARVAELEAALSEIAGGICCGCCEPGDPHCDVGQAKDALRLSGNKPASLSEGE